MRSHFLLLFLLLFQAPCWSAPFDCLAGYIALSPSDIATVRPRAKYHVSRQGSKPITFSYEVEFFPEEARGLVNYYRVPEISEASWNRMTPEARHEKLLEKIRASRKDERVAVRLSDAPTFLSEEMIRETSTDQRVELSRNEIQTDLGEVFGQFDWIETNIGKGYPQGHIAFNRKGVNLEGAPTYLKLDGDLAMASSLVHSFRSYRKDLASSGIEQRIPAGDKTVILDDFGVKVVPAEEAGRSAVLSRYPARAMFHRSLGPMDLAAYEVLKSWTEAEEVPKIPDIHKGTKFNFGIVLRPDLYGEDGTGFEVRNPGVRFADLKFRMLHLAETLEEGFGDYRPLDVRPTTVSSGALKRASPHARALYKVLGTALTEANRGQNFSTPFEDRFSFPHLDWSRHPYILALSPEARGAFRQKLAESTREYEQIIEQLPVNSDMLPAVQVALSKWASDIQLDHYLAEGARSIARPTP